MSTGTMIKVATGMYYSLGSLYMLNKLDGHSDVVKPLSIKRIINEEKANYGFLAFHAGLLEPQLIPDSGIVKQDKGAYTVKIPWEAEFIRKRPPANLYDPSDPYWHEWKEEMFLKLKGKAKKKELTKIVTNTKIRKYLDAVVKEPLPKTVQFEISGHWTSEFLRTPEKISEFSISIIGQETFKQSSLAAMRKLNKGGTATFDLLRNGVKSKVNVKRKKLAYPIYFDRIYNPKFTTNKNWLLGVSNVLHLKPIGVSDLQLRRWFNYEDPDTVNLLINDASGPRKYQELELFF